MQTALFLSRVAAALLAPIAAHAASSAQGQAMSIVRNGEQPAIMGAPGDFTGNARIDPLMAARAPSTVSAGQVTFQPGGRSVWHTHPKGQTLVVTAGTGWVQQEGAQKTPIKPGDVIWTPPGVKHWHGATATTGMSHIAIQEALDGKNVEWLEPVSAADYEASR
ncbi:cupin domain-containing protein [Pseudomonas sp. NPDC007930]|uniref:(R)-mandelonitrile lyase n=1 Tax=Pseudomonas sp. NPDC007930 TaxID=3364417 RepID=UPI0036EAB0EC